MYARIMATAPRIQYWVQIVRAYTVVVPSSPAEARAASPSFGSASRGVDVKGTMGLTWSVSIAGELLIGASESCVAASSEGGPCSVALGVSG